jgi:PAS domain S-box-containing protein
MKDASKTDQQLREEIALLRQRIDELERSGARRKPVKRKEGANERKYRIVADNTYDWEYWLDPEHRFIYCSPSCLRITGHGPEEFLADPNLLLEIIHPDHRPTFSQHIMSAPQKGQTDELELLIVRPDGTERWIGQACQTVYDQDGTFIGIRGSNRDISERKKIAEERDRILNMSSDLICIAGMDGYFRYVNPAWEKTLGYEKEDLLALPVLDFIHPEDHHKTGLEVRKLATGRPTVDFENRYIHKDGSVRTFLWIATPLPEQRLIYCFGRDITERKRFEEERGRLITELQKALANVKALRGLLPICSSCKKIRDDKGYWERIEIYIHEHSEAEFTHGLCPECTKMLYPEVYKDVYPDEP